jgi:hypothetical protein
MLSNPGSFLLLREDFTCFFCVRCDVWLVNLVACGVGLLGSVFYPVEIKM